VTWDHPGEETIEVSVIGRGYGECVIVYLGWGDWLVVDSCTPHRGLRTSYAVDYLKSLEVDLAGVRWLLASHWHDDHVAGFAHLATECETAHVYMSEALRSEEFVVLAKIEVDEPAGALSSGVAEMSELLEALKLSGRKVRQARADQRLFSDDRGAVTREIWALSPSNAASLLSKSSFAQDLLPVRAERRRIPAPSPNETSVALHIRVGPAVCVLGADLVWHDAEDRGWKAVLASEGRPTERARLYKVAHHGSSNADHELIWARLMKPQPIAVLAPYGSGKKPRPALEDVDRITGRAAATYLAGPMNVNKPKASSPVEKIRRKTTANSVVSERSLGHVRARFDLHGSEWEVSLTGEAQQLHSSLT
jgi:beta-lactamase superfamily II metal-dependent hydrolase